MKRIVIVGGVAGGATAAARISRLSDNFDVTIIERSPNVSFANCGLPYYIGREIKDRSRLALQTPQSLNKNLGVHVQIEATVTAVDRALKTVAVKQNGSGVESQLSYDKLLLSPGATPIIPAVEGVHDPRILTLRNLVDMDRIDAVVRTMGCKRVAVVGAGFIGLEMCEQLQRTGKQVVVIEKAPHVLPQADPEIAHSLEAALRENGIEVRVGDGLKAFRPGDGGSVRVVLESGTHTDVDLVIMSVGVRPESDLAKACGLELTPRGHIKVNKFMQTADPDVFAVGDVIDTPDMVFPQFSTPAALGNVANQQARIAADMMAMGKSVAYKGSLGTSIVRVFHTVVAVTGWTETRLKREGIKYETTIVTADNHAGYYPGALPVTLKITFDPTTGRIFGAQGFGTHGVDKRIDIIATAIMGGLSVDELSLAQLTYSPPFGSARDVVNIAGLAARNAHEGLIKPVTAVPPDAQLVDVRVAEVARLQPIKGSINIPLLDVKTKAAALLDKNKKVVTLCSWGKTAYFAARTLVKQGFDASPLVGGIRVHYPAKDLEITPTFIPQQSEEFGAITVELDCTAMHCPGPIYKLRDACETLPKNALLVVKASDDCFAEQVVAFAKTHKLLLVSIAREGPFIIAKLYNGDLTHKL